LDVKLYDWQSSGNIPSGEPGQSETVGTAVKGKSPIAGPTGWRFASSNVVALRHPRPTSEKHPRHVYSVPDVPQCA
jgi:hypothetical protein